MATPLVVEGLDRLGYSRGLHARQDEGGLRGPLRLFLFVGPVAFGIQFLTLLFWSLHLYRHFDLSGDMAAYSQAWHQIATGHLNPTTTLYPSSYPHYGYPFIQGHFELILWPLALCGVIWPHPVFLLIAQDLALSFAGLIALRWGVEHLAEHWPFSRSWAAAGVAGALFLTLLLTPWTLWTASFDFHPESIALPFLLLAGRDLAAERRRGLAFGAVVLLCGDVASISLIALALAMVVIGFMTPRRRADSLLLLAMALAWSGLIDLLGTGRGSKLDANYSFLVGHPLGDGLGAFVAILLAFLAHPTHVEHLLAQRHDAVLKFIGGAGSVGIVTPLGLLALVFVILPNALGATVSSISAAAAYLNLAAVDLTALGIVFLASALAARPLRALGIRLGIPVALACSLFAVVQTAVVSSQWTPRAGAQFLRVDGPAAAELASLTGRIPLNDEVIVSVGVAGRFGSRPVVYPFTDAYRNGQTVPLSGKKVYIVLWASGNSSRVRAAATELRVLGARQLVDAHGVVAFAWTRPSGRHAITFPR